MAAAANRNGDDCEAATKMQCKRGVGSFQWDRGAWFGAQVGSTCFLFAWAILVLNRSPLLAAILFGCFALPNVIGTAFWKNRDKLDSHRAFQAIVLIELVCTATAMLSADRLGFLADFDDRIENPYLLLLMYPAMMVFFYYQHRAQSRQLEKDQQAD